MSTPTPFKKIPLTMIRKYLKGLRYVMYWNTSGIVSMGVANPERRMTG